MLTCEHAVLCPTQHTMGHFGEQFFQVIPCTGTAN